MNIKEVRDFTGMEVNEIKVGMANASSDDPLMGAAYAYASGLAVNIKNDRHEWNMKQAQVTYETWKERYGNSNRQK